MQTAISKTVVINILGCFEKKFHLALIVSFRNIYCLRAMSLTSRLDPLPGGPGATSPTGFTDLPV
jgi:hypothetical protein